jgi:hypothetical protein
VPVVELGLERVKYGIRKEAQELVAGIRTDLDSFSEVEADALMTSGYRMTEHYLPKVEVLPTHRQEPWDWDFLAIERVLRDARPPTPAINVYCGYSEVRAAECSEFGRWDDWIECDEFGIVVLVTATPPTNPCRS